MYTVLKNNEVLPNETELIKYILEVSIHSWNVHYYEEALGEKPTDPELPHDMKGKWNRLEPVVVTKIALQFLPDGNKLYHDIIMEGVRLHGQQYHHQMWKNPSLDVPEDSRKLSSVDAICSMIEPLEHRKYRGEVHTWEKIKQKIAESASHQIPWMEYAYREMIKIEQPNLKEITSFSKIPKKGISPEMHDAIIDRAYEALRELERMYGYKFYKNSERYIIDILK